MEGGKANRYAALQGGDGGGGQNFVKKLVKKLVPVSAVHIPGTQNTEADSFFRNFDEAIEWKLSTHLFQKICLEKKYVWKPNNRPFCLLHKLANG